MNNNVALYDDNFVVRSIIKKIDNRYNLLVNTNRYLVAQEKMARCSSRNLPLNFEPAEIKKRRQNRSTLL